MTARERHDPAADSSPAAESVPPNAAPYLPEPVGTDVPGGSPLGAPAIDPAGAPDPRKCDWCDEPIPEDARRDAEVCGVVCRKRRWRFRRAVLSRSTRDVSPVDAGRPRRFAYADPPYPGKHNYYVERRAVDHRELVRRLEADFPDGWALSTSAEALPHVLCLCRSPVRVAVWRRRVRVTRSSRPLSGWEPLILAGGRPLDTSRAQQLVDDLDTGDLVADDVLDYRGRYDSFPGALTGMKPPEFAAWMFAQLGARAGDELVDLYPGSGAIGRAWSLYTAWTKQ